METHSSILIPWTEEPGGLPSVGSQESDTLAYTHAHSYRRGWPRGAQGSQGLLGGGNI